MKSLRLSEQQLDAIQKRGKGKKVSFGLGAQEGKKRNKFNALKTVVDGIKFDSKKEAKQYEVFKFMQHAGEIADLECQVQYDLFVNNVLICKYFADFVFKEAGEDVVVDVKGMKTREYELKKKLMLAVYGIEIREM